MYQCLTIIQICKLLADNSFLTGNQYYLDHKHFRNNKNSKSEVFRIVVFHFPEGHPCQQRAESLPGKNYVRNSQF
jgi:hypothetical protein